MFKFLRGMVIISILFALTGCYKGELSLGSLSPTVQKRYEVSDSSFDEAFRMAKRAIEETKIEIYNSNMENGHISAGINKTTNMGDTRSFVKDFAEFDFFINKNESGKLVFMVESKSSSGSEAYIDKFLEQYSTYIDFTEISDDKPVVPTEDDKRAVESSDHKIVGVGGGHTISEIRVGSPVLPDKNYEFSKQEIIQVQTFLKKLGYDPGPVDGEMNNETMEAIEKFKKENKVVDKLFD